MELFGFKVWEKEDKKEDIFKSVSKDENDGSLVVTTGLTDYSDMAVGDAYATSHSFDVDPTITSEFQLITKYRELSLIPEIEKAVDNIINEMISTDENDLVSLDLDDVPYQEGLKKKIQEEFKHIINLMNFNNNGFEILKRWYIDGRFQYQVVINQETAREQGIGKLTYIDPRKLKKVRVYNKEKDQRTSVDLYTDLGYYFEFNENGYLNTNSNYTTTNHSQDSIVKLSPDSVVQVTSGLLNPNNTVVLSYLHKAIRPLNQLKSLEDASLIYRITRAPERRVFYIEVGNLPPAKAEQALRRQMQQYKSKTIYDTGSGTVRGDPKVMTMVEDYWLPRRGDGKATEITTLPAGNLADDTNLITYFLNKLYNSLNVPITRMDPSAGFSIGRSTEITRDEAAFIKFVNRLRRRFGELFIDLLKRQLALKNIVTPDDFEEIRNKISVEFHSDNYFNELVANEVLEGRLNLLDRISQHVGVFFSKEYVNRNVLQLSDEESLEMKEQMDAERNSGEYDDMMMNGEDDTLSTIKHISDPDSNKPPPKPRSAGQSTQTINNQNNTNQGNTE